MINVVRPAFKYLRQVGCPVQNCLITRNSQRLTYIKDFDVLLFVGEDDVVDYVQRVEMTRTPKQIYAMILAEPPHLVPTLTALNDKINWTISYRADAEVKFTYGSAFDRDSKEEVTRNSMWRGFDSNKVSSFVRNSEMPKIVYRKQKMIAWFVSNCNMVQSRRMELAQAINRYIPVDMYGDCGKLKCQRGDAKCQEMLEEDYLFYLSFENSLCKDYITEKTFHVMSRTIIPVIYSAADVSQLLPPKSYINVEDYETVEDLTDYLVFLAGNREEYLKFFWWKEFYVIKELHYACYLCKRLNEMGEGKKEVRSYANVDEWFKKDICRAPKIKF